MLRATKATPIFTSATSQPLRVGGLRHTSSPVGLKDRVFALGPEFNVFIPGPRLTFLVRYEPEFGARNRSQGQTVIFSIAWVAKLLVKHQP